MSAMDDPRHTFVDWKPHQLFDEYARTQEELTGLRMVLGDLKLRRARGGENGSASIETILRIVLANERREEAMRAELMRRGEKV